MGARLLRRLRWGRILRVVVVALALAQLARVVATMVHPTSQAVVPTAAAAAAATMEAGAGTPHMLLTSEGAPASAGHMPRSSVRQRRRPGSAVVAGSTSVPAWRRLPMSPHLPPKEEDDDGRAGAKALLTAGATGPRLVPSFIIAGAGRTTGLHGPNALGRQGHS